MRIEQVDALRGLGITLVVIYHIFFDSYFFGIVDIDPTEGVLKLFGLAAASIMIVVVGISLSLSYEKIKNSDYKTRIKKYLTRSLKLFVVALAISAISYIFYPQGWIRWGVIHFISFAVFFCHFFARFERLNAILAMLSITIGKIINEIQTDNFLLFIVGYYYPIYSIDYFPIFPWIGLVFLGMYVGKKIYIQKKMNLEEKKIWIEKYLAILGRNSLIIYLTHQIPLISFILILKKFS
ncbi:MAG: heparan-alpha-glucosaminide N-acetyltransferase [Candidatus Anstonellaceae archaeon]